MADHENFFDFNIRILKWSGLWVSHKSDPAYKKRIAYNTICVFYSIIFFTVAEFVALQESSKNLDDLIKNLNMSLSFLLTFFKVCVWFYNRKAILDIMDTLQKNSTLFDGSKDFDPRAAVANEKKIKDALTMCFFTLSCLVPSSACLATFNELVSSTSLDLSNGTAWQDMQTLPYYSWVPFDYKASKIAFGSAVIYQCLALLSCGTITVGLDMLYIALVSFMSSHFKVAQGAFKSIRCRCLKRLNMSEESVIRDSPELTTAMEAEMKYCIRYLQMLFRLCEMLERIYSNLILMQVLISLVVLCTCLFLVSSIPIGKELFGNELAYLLAIENQLAVYCYVGDKVTQSADGIPLAIYEGDWFSASKSFKTSMIITMMRMRIPVYLTIGKFTPLTLNTFVTIGRRSYSLLAVLKSE